MVVKDGEWLSLVLNLCQVYFLLELLICLFILSVWSCRFVVWDDFFAIVRDDWFTAIDFLFQTIIKSALPNIDNLVRSTRNKVIALSTESRVVWMSLKCVLQSAFLRIPNFCSPIFRWANEKWTMRVEVYWFYWAFMAFVHLNHVLRS